MKDATVFVFASAPEARPLLDTFERAPLRDPQLLLHGLDEALLLICGRGPSAAGAAIDALARSYRPRRVVLGGVARRLHESLPVGGIAQIGAASFDHPQRTTYVPVSRLTADDLPGVHGDCTLLSRSAPLIDGVERARLAGNADLVDSEGAAVACACVEHGIECAIFKVIGESVGEPGLSAGMMNELNTRLAAFLLRHYDALTQGVRQLKPRHAALG